MPAGAGDRHERDRLIGEVLASRYQIETRLGEGAMGAVYRAKHVKVGRAFAVKVLHARLLVDDKVVQRFEREAELAGRLRHPNVIGVVDVGEMPDGTRYMVMDFAEGPDLAALLPEAPMPAPRIIHLVRQMLEGLYHAHEQGLIHRDFKPENVIVEHDSHGAEVPRIVDFGIAILREGGDSADGPGRLTTNGLVLGTPHYMAPEQAVADPIDHRIDLFALGIMIYELLSGKLPFDGNGAEVARANLLLDPPRISERVPYLEVDPLLEAYARRLMSKKRDLRPATAKAARELLDLIERDRSAAAAALGIPHETVRSPLTTMDATPPLPPHTSQDTFPPPFARDHLATPPQAPPLAAPLALGPTAASPPVQRGEWNAPAPPPARKRAWLPFAIGGVAVTGIAVVIAIALRGGADDAGPSAKPDDHAVAIATPTPTPTPAPAPAPIVEAAVPDAPAPPEQTTPPPEPTKPAVVATPHPIHRDPPKLPDHKVVVAPKPPVAEAATKPPVAEAATKPLDEAAFKLEFQLVGKQLGDYEAKHGADATAELWTTYRRIRYGDAVSTQGKRDAAAAILRQIQHDMR